MIEGIRTPSQVTTWESAGTPVQPAYCSSPAERTRTGFSIVPEFFDSPMISTRPTSGGAR